MGERSILPALSEGQMQIMNVVWSLGEATVGEVWEQLSARRRVARNTVQTLMTRLEEKGWLAHRPRGGAFHYYARRPREATLRRVARRLLDGAFAGSVSGLVMALLDGREISSEEADRIRALIERAQKGQQ